MAEYLTNVTGGHALPQEVQELMAADLPAQGHEWQAVLESCPVQLGFLAASEGKPLAKLRAANPEFELQGNQRVLELMAGSAAHKATLVFAASGAPIVRVESGVAAAVQPDNAGLAGGTGDELADEELDEDEPKNDGTGYNPFDYD